MNVQYWKTNSCGMVLASSSHSRMGWVSATERPETQAILTSPCSFHPHGGQTQQQFDLIHIYIYKYSICLSHHDSPTSPDSSPVFVCKETTVFCSAYRCLLYPNKQQKLQPSVTYIYSQLNGGRWTIKKTIRTNEESSIFKKAKIRQIHIPTNPCQNYRAKWSLVRDNQEITFCTCQRFQK